MKGLKILVLGGVALSLAACEGGPKQRTGTLLGAVAGAVAGAQVGKGEGRIVGAAVGTLLGALAGSEIGKSLDRADIAYLRQTQQRALEKSPSGKTSTWVNPDSGNSGGVTPKPAYKNSSGAYCREFQQTITVGGKDGAGLRNGLPAAGRHLEDRLRDFGGASTAQNGAALALRSTPRGGCREALLPLPLVADVFLFSLGCFRPGCGYRPWIAPSRKWKARRHVHRRKIRSR